MLCLRCCHRSGRRGLRLSPAPGERPAVLLVAPHLSYRIAPFVRAAEGLGARTLVASEGRHTLVAAAAAGIHVDFGDPERAVGEMVAAAREAGVGAVIGTDDRSVELAARVAARLGLVHNPPGAARLSRRKDLARARLQAAGLPVPGHRRLVLDRPLVPQLGGLRYPLVLKPLALSASRGVIRCDDDRALEVAGARIRALLEQEGGLEPEARSHILAEAFIDGPEFALEGMLTGGSLRRLALFDKPDPLQGPFFEETYYISPSRLAPELQARALDTVERACAALGLREGPVHAEFRIRGGEVWLLDLASRTIGGQCARLLRLGTGHGLEELVIAHALGRAPTLRPLEGGAGVLMIPIPGRGVLRRVEGIAAARRVRWIEEVQIDAREGYELVPLPEAASYLGFIFARAPGAAEAEAALREAWGRLRVITAPVLAAGR